MAVDPSESFVAACRDRYPGVDARVASAEALPFGDRSFDAAIAQLVVHFMKDPVRGVAEMRRVTRAGGRVAASVWDYADGMILIRKFWDAARALEPAATAKDEINMEYTTPSGLGGLWREAGLGDVQVVPIDVAASYDDFEDLWWPLETGVGPAGAYAAALSDDDREALKDEFRRHLGVDEGPFELNARAWLATGIN
jgi:SAM-dependent methyltransferase